MAESTFIGVIGGSGIYDLDKIKVLNEYDLTTPFGKPSAPVLEAEINGGRFFFIPRHGKGHSLAPSEVNYRANVFALKTLGTKYIVSVSAVGSLKEELPPTLFVLPDQFIDWTKGLRKRTFFEEGVVGHVSAAHPVNMKLQELIACICEREKINFSKGGAYVCIEGPQFSTKAESTIYRSFGASVIGMTNVPEAFLAKEAGIAYATVAMVTDYDCWKEEHCTTEEILKVMKENNVTALKLIENLIPEINNNPFDFEKENQFAVITHAEKISPDKKAVLDILLR